MKDRFDERTERLKEVDNQTLGFKRVLDDLPAVERRVFVGLLNVVASGCDGASAAQIAKAARSDVHEVSTLICRSARRGLVVYDEGTPRQYWPKNPEIATWWAIRSKRARCDDRAATVRERLDQQPKTRDQKP